MLIVIRKQDADAFLAAADKRAFVGALWLPGQTNISFPYLYPALDDAQCSMERERLSPHADPDDLMRCDDRTPDLEHLPWSFSAAIHELAHRPAAFLARRIGGHRQVAQWWRDEVNEAGFTLQIALAQVEAIAAFAATMSDQTDVLVWCSGARDAWGMPATTRGGR